jgi:hypothetical protein
MLYFTLFTYRLELVSVVRPTLTSAEANRLECIQWKILAPYYSNFFPQIRYRYLNDLHEKNAHTLCARRCNLFALFLLNAYNGFTFCPSLLETVGIRFLVRNFEDFPLFACWFLT